MVDSQKFFQMNGCEVVLLTRATHLGTVIRMCWSVPLCYNNHHRLSMFLDGHKVEMRNVAATDQITVEISDRSAGAIRFSRMYREYSKSTERPARR